MHDCPVKNFSENFLNYSALHWCSLHNNTINKDSTLNDSPVNDDIETPTNVPDITTGGVTRSTLQLKSKQHRKSSIEKKSYN